MKKHGWNWRNWAQNLNRRRSRKGCNRATPGGIKVRMKRYKRPYKGCRFGVQVKKYGRWKTVGYFRTEDAAVREVEKQRNLQDIRIDLT